MTIPEPTDLLEIDSFLSEEERDIRASVRAMLGEAVLPHVAPWTSFSWTTLLQLPLPLCSSSSL